MKKIQLTQGKVALVDDEDYEEINRYRWCANKKHNIFYATRNSTKLERENGYPTFVLMHRQILGIIDKPGDTDHISGEGLDNQKVNLRIVTNRQNLQNRHEKKSSVYPGVYWHKGGNKWVAKIYINGVLKYLGLYTNEYEAFEAYKEAVNILGEVMVDEI